MPELTSRMRYGRVHHLRSRGMEAGLCEQSVIAKMAEYLRCITIHLRSTSSMRWDSRRQ